MSPYDWVAVGLGWVAWFFWFVYSRSRRRRPPAAVDRDGYEHRRAADNVEPE